MAKIGWCSHPYSRRYAEPMIDLIAVRHWHLRSFSVPLAHAYFSSPLWVEWEAPADARLILVYDDGVLVAGFWP